MVWMAADGSSVRHLAPAEVGTVASRPGRAIPFDRRPLHRTSGHFSPA